MTLAGEFPITIDHNPACGTSRNTLAMIRAAGCEPTVSDAFDLLIERHQGTARGVALTPLKSLSARCFDPPAKPRGFGSPVSADRV